MSANGAPKVVRCPAMYVSLPSPGHEGACVASGALPQRLSVRSVDDHDVQPEAWHDEPTEGCAWLGVRAEGLRDDRE